MRVVQRRTSPLTGWSGMSLVPHRRRSNWTSRREILESVSLNREVDTVKVSLQKRSPFDYLSEKPFLKIGRGEWI
jgi:hypothetical protein